MLILIIFYKIKENFDNNYRNDIYLIRPPYKISNLYNPKKIAPIHILKYNFLNIPIFG